MDNIGCVIYTKGEEPGSLNAKWCHSIMGSGIGKATGGPVESIEGKYHIVYYDDNGNEIADRELYIEKKSNYYKMTWYNKGEITASGIGMQVEKSLVAGWYDIN